MVGFEVFVLSVPPYLSSTPGGVGMHSGSRSFTGLIGVSATPPSLWPGRELRKFHCFVQRNDIQFSRYGSQFGALPCLGNALAVNV